MPEPSDRFARLRRRWYDTRMHPLARVLLAVLLLHPLLPATAEDAGALSVCAVQYRVTPRRVLTERGLLASAGNAVEAAVAAAAATEPVDLVVFPEYTSAFVALERHATAILQAQDLEEAVRRVLHGRTDQVRELFLQNAPAARQRLDRVWGTLARRHGVYIAAGTYFARQEGRQGPQLRNRLLVYGPEGRLVYRQDKVFLTPFEREVLRLAPGSLKDAAGLAVEEATVGFTICRDTFMDEWESHFDELFLWVDLKANGVAFDAAQRENFRKALPERIAQSTVPYGLTVCLTGRFLDLFWEGPSSFIAGNGGTVVPLVTAPSHNEGELLRLSVPYGG